MSSTHEITVASSSPMPNGYAFLPKGDMYKTLHCRRLTHAARKPLFVVEDRQHKKIGIRIPRKVFFTVNNLARETAATRNANTERRDANLIAQAAAELREVYPNIPSSAAEQCLKRAFRKYSGRVGRSGKIEMKRKVELAVVAHARHTETAYDDLLRKGISREEARLKVWSRLQEVLRDWKGKQHGQKGKKC